MTPCNLARLLPGLLVALAAASPAGLQAQHERPPPPAAYALENVTVVDAEGGRQEGVTLVVRGGLIETLRAGAPVPPGVRVLEGDSLLVYPGLVDAWGAAELEFPGPGGDDGGRDREILPWDPPRTAQGFTPHRRVAEGLVATGEDLEESRRAGIVAQAVHPTEGLAPGRGAVILNRKGTEHPRNLIARAELGPTFTFDGARGSYPSTLFGVIAFHRQTFHDAARMALIQNEYRQNPSGLTAPRWDPDHGVYQEVASGRTPVFFHADGAEDIRRVLGLADEFGFRPVIVGGGEAWKVADELRERSVPVLVSLDFPAPRDWEPEEGEEEEEAMQEEQEEEQEEEEQEAREQESQEPLEPAAWREKERLENLYANAGRLAEAGVTFALTSGGGEADLREGARKAMEYGLSEEAALAALTSSPARLLGVPHVPRVEEGMSATFVVVDGPLFDEETDVTYTFVEGLLEEGGSSGGGDPPAADLTGSWSMTMETDQGSFELDLTLEQDGNELAGRAEGGPSGRLDVRNGNVSGSNVRFTFVIDAGGERLEISMNGIIEDPDHFSGTGSSDFGPMEFVAARTGEGPGAGGLR